MSQSIGACSSLQQLLSFRDAQRLRASPLGAPALAAGRRLRSGGSLSGGGGCRWQRATAARALPRSELASSPAQEVSTEGHYAGSGSGGVSGGEGSSTDYPPASYASGPSSSSSSSSFTNGSNSLNGSSQPPHMDKYRSASSTSELLRAVLKRRAERLQRQVDAYPPPPDAPQQAATTEPPQQHPPQQPQPPQPPPRYKLPPNWSGPGSTASPAAASPPASTQLNGTAAAAPQAPPPAAAPPAYQPSAALQIVPAPEQRVVRSPAALAAREDAIAQRKLATVRFWLKFRAEWGQRLRVVGTHTELGAWVLGAAPELKWSEGDNWHVTVQLPAGGVVEYKYVLLDHSGTHPVAWQQGNNSVLALRPGDELVEVFDNWGAEPGAKLVADGGAPVTREQRLLSWAAEMEAQLVSQKQDLRRSRMELAAAQEEAREARMEAQRYKARLMAVEAEKAEAASSLQQAQKLNDVLQAQLADTTASFQDALRTAASILSQIDEVSAADVATAPEGDASSALPPPLPIFQLPEAQPDFAQAFDELESEQLVAVPEAPFAAEEAAEAAAVLEELAAASGLAASGAQEEGMASLEAGTAAGMQAAAAEAAAQASANASWQEGSTSGELPPIEALSSDDEGAWSSGEEDETDSSQTGAEGPPQHAAPAQGAAAGPAEVLSDAAAAEAPARAARHAPYLSSGKHRRRRSRGLSKGTKSSRK